MTHRRHVLHRNRAATSSRAGRQHRFIVRGSAGITHVRVQRQVRVDKTALCRVDQPHHDENMQHDRRQNNRRRQNTNSAGAPADSQHRGVRRQRHAKHVERCGHAAAQSLPALQSASRAATSCFLQRMSFGESSPPAAARQPAAPHTTCVAATSTPGAFNAVSSTASGCCQSKFTNSGVKPLKGCRRDRKRQAR